MQKSEKTSGATVAVVIGRKKSKRIPRKNMKEFCGKPLATYPIAAATSCNLFSNIFVSSDDQELLALAESYNAVPLPRPSHLADDKTPTIPVVRNIINQIESLGSNVDLICCLYDSHWIFYA